MEKIYTRREQFKFLSYWMGPWRAAFIMLRGGLSRSQQEELRTAGY
jgi:hypothetical protein